VHIERVHIRNFRSILDETIYFNRYICLVGANGAGKSCVLSALNLFFRQSRDVATDLQELQVEDFHNKNTAEPIQVTVTFTGLSNQAQKDLRHYYRQGKLIITAIATYDAQTKLATVEQHGERLVMDEFRPWFEAQGASKPVGELRELYAPLRAQYALPAESTKGGMEGALRVYEEAHPEACTSQRSRAEFYGFTKGDNLLKRYIEWVYVPAVKDAATEQLEARGNALGQLVGRAVRTKMDFDAQIEAIRALAHERYRAMLQENHAVLTDLSQALQTRVSQWSHPGARVQLAWAHDEKTAVSVKDPTVQILASEGAFEGQLARFGHGLQRSYLLALLNELASGGGATGNTLILGCEEPELYQHPPQARHLASVLQTLSTQQAQIIVSTHSPHFVTGEAFEDVRVVRKDPQTGVTRVRGTTFEAIAARIAVATGAAAQQRAGEIAKLHQVLQPNLNEIFFGSRIVLMEGAEDVAYVTAWLHLNGRWDEFRQRGVHLVATDKKSAMLRPLAVLLELDVPVFAVFDADGQEKHPTKRAKHEHDNLALLRALAVENPVAFPALAVWDDRFAQWPSCLSDQVKVEMGADRWARCCQRADQEWGYAGGLRKHAVHIGTALRLGRDEGGASPTLDTLCTRILA
jgi:putative ATP-dependent endonuclease of OLD family